MQRVKISSELQNIIKGVPQWSILSPILFNIFLKDIFASLSETTLWNYADDNTICNSDENIENVKSHLLSMTKIAIDWFERNCIQANSEKNSGNYSCPCQEWVLRFVYRDHKSSYEELLDQAKLQSVHLGRLRSLATEIHKAVHGGVPPYVRSLFTERESEYSLRRNHSLILPPYNTISFGKQSIRYTGPKVWNSLPNNLRQTTSLKEFWSGTNCTCSVCCYKKYQ